MKKAEIESFVKSFLLFFVSQTLLVGALFYLQYKQEVKTLDENLFSQMKICSYSLTCKEFEIDFVPSKKYEVFRLYKTPQSLESYFPIPNSTKHLLKISLRQQYYEEQLLEIQKRLWYIFVAVLAVIALLSLLFSLYALAPLKNALHVTEEFIKDILHDFNTPISTLRLNVSMLQKEYAQEKKLTRIQNALQNILNLQANLKSYLNNELAYKEEFPLKEFLQQRAAMLQSAYKEIHFSVDIPKNKKLYTNKDAFTRIVDNLLSNAAKYNKKGGKVEIFLEDNRLHVKDSGKGIRNPKKVFERFYKEQERGIGIGLHIVKKLCDELGIKIEVHSIEGKGSDFVLWLDFDKK